MTFFKNLGSILTTTAGIAVAVGGALTAAGVPGGEAVTVGATAFIGLMAKDGHKEG